MTSMSMVAARSKAAPRPSTFALKLVMAATGVVFVGFVVVHLIGNLKVYAGAAAFDSYAHWLREVGYPLVPKQGVLWALRVVLLVSLVAHVGSAVVLWRRGRAARGRHRRRRMSGGLMPFGARTMLLSGLLILVFVVIHLLDLTVGAVVAPEGFRGHDADGTTHAYANLVASLSRPWAAACYSLTMVVLALHVLHGCRTLMQDLGATGARLRQVWVAVAGLVALAILAGNALIPVFVVTGVIS